MGWRLTQTPYNVSFIARPPRVPVMLPWECQVIYFITLCVVPRCNALANDAAWKAVCEALGRLNKWNTYCIMMMPDHIHLLTAPSDRELSVCRFSEMVQALVQRLI
jgi:hypothetical protein